MYTIQPAIDRVIELAKSLEKVEHVYQAIPSAKTDTERRRLFGSTGRLHCIKVWNFQGMPDDSPGNFIKWHDLIFVDCWYVFGGDEHDKILQSWIDRITGLMFQAKTLGSSVHEVINVVKKRQPSEDYFGEIPCHFGRVEVTVGQLLGPSHEELPWQN